MSDSATTSAPSVVIFGGTGYAGGHIAARAAARGLRVTAVSRTAPTAPLEGVDYLQGRLSDTDLVRSLATDHDVVVLAVHGQDVDGRKLVEHMPAIVGAVTEGGARLAVVGGAGSLRTSSDGPRVVDTPEFPEAFKGEALAHADVLAWLRTEADSDAEWFYLSPAITFGSFAPGETTGSYRTSGDIAAFDDNGVSEISGTDYALAFVDEIVEPKHRNTRFTVAH
ncbi:NAD(P)H-binding protein [Rhodococcus sp. HNM0569]|uniref:NAD(P)-dependent oxidoreductase n=1 Tax=Rhodococcus sp. HNM0569 TaxID=2716340 RepID=UPI003211CBBC